MGQLFKFNCPSCGYSTQVSGRTDFGFIGVTVTIACKQCRQLYDISVENMKPWEVTSDWHPSHISCPKSNEHKVHLWEHPDKCPKCPALMDRGEVTLYWD